MIANAAVGKSWAGVASGILTGLVAGGTFLLGALDLAGAQVLAVNLSFNSRLGLDGVTMASGFLAAATTSKGLRQVVARFMPLDPDHPVHALALALAIILFGTQVASYLFTDVLTAEQSQPSLGVGDLVLQEVPFLILAAFGVGIFIRRNLGQVINRLGVVKPAWWQVTLAVAAAGVAFVFAQQMNVFNHTLQPQTAQQVDVTTQHLFGGLDNNNVAGIVALALAPGICEELLFRGALQPRLGLVATALLFASIHAQYGLSLDALAVFIIALGLGVIRKFTNTTTSGLCHVTYNGLSAIGIAGAWVGPAVVVELGLAAISVYAIAGRRLLNRAPSRP